MNKVIILTDSTADLNREIREQYNILSIPLYVRFDDEIYLDGVNLTTEDLYHKVSEKKIIPKTSAVSPGDFIAFFTKYLVDGYDILYIGIGSKLSATHQSAVLARDEFADNRIFIVDSQNLSSGIALLVLKACLLRDQGLSASEIMKKINLMVLRVRSQFAIQTLEYLHKGGRASGTAKLFGSILGIKPIIRVRNGSLEVYKKPAGKMSRALDLMLLDYFNEGENLDLDFVMITHSLANKQALYMIEKIKEKTNPKHVIESKAGCVISSHCGPGTIGILYIVQK